MPETTPSPEAIARRKLFTAALRSGRFKQGKGQLATGLGDEVRHCCLDVACVVAIENGLNLPFMDDEDGDRWYSTSGDPEDRNWDNHSVLPLTVMKWYGFPDMDPNIPIMWIDDMTGLEQEYEFPASEVNDTRGKDFAEIADAFDTKYVHPYELPEDPSGALEP